MKGEQERERNLRQLQEIADSATKEYSI